MGIFTRKAASPEKVAAEEVEGEIRKLVSRDVAEPRRQLANDGDMVAQNLTALVRRVSLDSVREIDGLINDLKVLRERLNQESQRMAHDIADYASLGPAATQSTRIIAEYLNYWKRVPAKPAIKSDAKSGIKPDAKADIKPDVKADTRE
jgi:hypothetical protein